MSIKIVKKLTGEILTPRRATMCSAGYDVFVSYTSTLKSGEDTYVTLPIALEFNPKTHRALMFLRSSIGMKKNIRFVEDGDIIPFVELVPNLEGIEKAVILRNTGTEDFLLEDGMHFAQIIIVDKQEIHKEFILESVNDLQGATPVSMSIKSKQNFVQTLILEEPLVLQAGESIMFGSGYKAKIDEDTFLGGYVPKTENRFRYSNGIPIIDSDYYNSDIEGHMFFKIDNTLNEIITLETGTEIVDLFSIPFYKVDDEIAPTTKRTGGIGSTTEVEKTAN